MKNNQHKSIVFIGNHFSNRTGTKSTNEELISHLQNRGWQVFKTSRHQAKIIRLPDMVWTIVSERNHYKVAQVDVFSGQAFLWAYLTTRLLKRLGKAVILTLHGGNLPDFSTSHPGLVKHLLSLADYVTSPSRYLQEALKSDRTDIKIIPNGLNINQYPYRFRSSPKPILIWLRAFHEIYNPKLAIEVLDRLRKNFSDVHLIMIGPDKKDGSFEQTKKIIKDLNLDEFVEFSGAISKSDVPDWLNKGDIFLNTTNFDNTPISVMEAMACGLCVISTNVGGIPYLLDNGINGLLVPPNNPDVMANSIIRIMDENGLAQKLSSNARIKVEEFNWSNVLPAWENLIRSCM